MEEGGSVFLASRPLRWCWCKNLREILAVFDFNAKKTRFKGEFDADFLFWLEVEHFDQLFRDGYQESWDFNGLCRGAKRAYCTAYFPFIAERFLLWQAIYIVMDYFVCFMKDHKKSFPSF